MQQLRGLIRQYFVSFLSLLSPLRKARCLVESKQEDFSVYNMYYQAYKQLNQKIVFETLDVINVALAVMNFYLKSRPAHRQQLPLGLVILRSCSLKLSMNGYCYSLFISFRGLFSPKPHVFYRAQ